ncbi:MAG TPA: hypothetical protein VJH63_00860 [Candidatus Paceibacterota bacterium]
MKEQKNIFDNIAFWILFGVTFLLPIFFLPVTIANLPQAKLSLLSIATLLALCCFIIEKIRHGSITLSLKPINVFFVLIPLLYLVASITGVNWHKSIIGELFEQDTLHTIAVLMLFTFLIASVARTAKRIGSLIFAFSFSIIIAIVFQLFVVFGGNLIPFELFSSPAFTLSGTWNDMTILSIVLLGVILVTLETIRLKKWITVALILVFVIPFFFISLSSLVFDFYIITLPLSVLIGLISLLIFAYLFSLRKARQKESSSEEKDISLSKHSLIPMPSLILLVLSFSLVIFGAPISRFLIQTTGVAYTEGQINWRGTYEIASKTLSQRPFFGSGPNSFASEWNIHKPASINATPFWNTDFRFGVGIIPTSIVTTGIVGFILWILFYTFVIGTALRVLFNFKNGASTLPLRIIVSFTVLLTAFMMIFYAPGIIVTATHFLFIGLLLALDSGGKKEKQIVFSSIQWQNFVATVIFIVAFVCIVFWAYRIVLKNAANFYAETAIVGSKNENEALDYINQAISLDPSRAIYSQLASQAYASKVAKTLSLGATPSESVMNELRGDVVSIVNYAVRAEALDPTDYNNRIATGRMLDLLGVLGVPEAGDQAILKYISASELSPSNPLPYLLASNAALTINDQARAKDYLIKALTLKSDYSDFPALGQEITTMIERINSAGNTKKAIDPVATSSDENTDDEKKSE